jgi:S-DNA-T family DNA segregation ATPase FtsK/SpoIIIE
MRTGPYRRRRSAHELWLWPVGAIVVLWALASSGLADLFALAAVAWWVNRRTGAGRLAVAWVMTVITGAALAATRLLAVALASTAGAGVGRIARRLDGRQLRARRVPVHNASVWDGIPFAVDDRGRPIRLPLVYKSLLIGGVPGSGKTVALRLLVMAAAQDPDVDLYLVDGKRVGLGPFRDRARRFASEPDEVLELLAELCEVMMARYDVLVDRGEEEIRRGDGFPVLFLVVDELSFFTDRGAPHRERTDVLLGNLVKLGRAAGVVVVAATQKPTTDVISSQVRDNIGWRLALRTRTREATVAILGDVRPEDAPAHELADDPGVGYLLAEDGRPQLVRTYDVTLDEARRRAGAG